MTDANHLDEYETQFSSAMVGGMLFAVAAMWLSGPLAVAAAVIGGTLFGVAAATFFQADKEADFVPPATRSQRERSEQAAGPQRTICLEADAGDAGRLWRERVEQNAQARVAGCGRHDNAWRL